MAETFNGTLAGISRWGETGLRVALVPHDLPDQLKRELNLAGRCLCERYESRAGNGISDLVKNHAISLSARENLRGSIH